MTIADFVFINGEWSIVRGVRPPKIRKTYVMQR